MFYSIQADRAFGTDSCHMFLLLSFYSKLEVFLLSFYSKLGSIFLNRTLLGNVESLRSESGSFFFHYYFTKLGLLFLNRTLLGGVESLRSESGI